MSNEPISRQARGVGVMLCWLVLFGIALPLQALASTSVDSPVKAHHVHLTGTAFEAPMDQMLPGFREGCARIGMQMQELPDGEKMVKSTQDVYYGPGAMTVYDTEDTNTLDVNTCRWQHKTVKKISVFTAAGICRIDLQKMGAVGKACHLSASGILSGKPPRASHNDAQRTGEFKTIANVKCAVLKIHTGGFNKRFCAAVAGPLAEEFMEPPSSIRGALLEHQAWNDGKQDELLLNLKATDIEVNVSVPLSILAPHLTGQFRIVP